MFININNKYINIGQGNIPFFWITTFSFNKIKYLIHKIKNKYNGCLLSRALKNLKTFYNWLLLYHKNQNILNNVGIK